MDLSKIKTLKQISEQTGIQTGTLKKRLKLKSFNMIEDEDFKSLGERQATLLSPEGIKKILRE